MGEIVGRVAAACRPVPVTAKIRLGATRDTINAIDVAQAIEAAGGAAVTVHGRTAADLFRGSADWDEIARIKPHLSRMPLIGNGDLRTPAAVVEAFARYGVDGVMIGRAALGRPWLFAQVAAALRGQPIPPDPTLRQQRQAALGPLPAGRRAFRTGQRNDADAKLRLLLWARTDRDSRLPPRDQPCSHTGGVRGRGNPQFSR